MSPDEELASLIANRLVEHDLVESDRRDELAAKVAAGTATPEDWRLWIELGPGGRPEETGHAQD